MNLTSNAGILLERSRAAHEAAVDDTLELAREIAGKHSRSGKFAASLQRTATVETSRGLETRIGSPLQSARAKEKGAWIAPKRAPYLTIKTADGWRRIKDGVRLAPQPAVTPAGARFRDFMKARLQQAGAR